MSSEQSEKFNAPAKQQEQQPIQQEVKLRKGKVCVKKGLDSRGRPSIEGKTGCQQIQNTIKSISNKN